MDDRLEKNEQKSGPNVETSLPEELGPNFTASRDGAKTEQKPEKSVPLGDNDGPDLSKSVKDFDHHQSKKLRAALKISASAKSRRVREALKIKGRRRRV